MNARIARWTGLALSCWYGEHEGTGSGFAYLGGMLFVFSEGRVLGRWDPFEERFVQAEGQ